MAEDEVFEEKIELTPREQIGLVMLESSQQQFLLDFKNFNLKPDNLKEFISIRKTMTFDNIKDSNVLTNKIIDKFKIHPDYKKYFKVVWEKEDKKPKEKDELEHHMLWHGFLREDWKQVFSDLMELHKEKIPEDSLLIEILKMACEKYEDYLFSPVASMQKSGVPSFGKGRTRVAADMHLAGRPHTEIASELGIQPKDVAQYIKIGMQKIEKEDGVKVVKADVADADGQ